MRFRASTDTDVSASITSDQPIAVERAMYWPDPFTSWYEAHDSAGVTQTGTHWALAEGEVGGPLGFETYILLANPSTTDATVTLSFLRAGGAAPLSLTRTVAGQRSPDRLSLGGGAWHRRAVRGAGRFHQRSADCRRACDLLERRWAVLGRGWE